MEQEHSHTYWAERTLHVQTQWFSMYPACAPLWQANCACPMFIVLEISNDLDQMPLQVLRLWWYKICKLYPTLWGQVGSSPTAIQTGTLLSRQYYTAVDRNWIGNTNKSPPGLFYWLAHGIQGGLRHEEVIWTPSVMWRCLNCIFVFIVLLWHFIQC